MAHGRPWYQRNGGDFLMATISFPDVETRWAYSAIIDMLNDRDRPIADEAGFICGFTGLTRKKWSIARAYLLGHGYLVTDQDGHLTNPRFERERAVREAKNAANAANGRIGGKMSAAARRMAGQPELGLEPGNMADSTPDSRGESTPESTPESPPNPSAKVRTGSQDNNDLAQATPQASRVRERASEARGESIEEDSSPTANPRNRGRASAVDVEEKADLLGITQRLARLGAVAMVNPSSHVQNIDTVKAWLAAGYDLEQTIIPAIEHQLTNTKHETIGSLNFYSAHIAKAHAQQARKPKASNIDKPIYLFPDEDGTMGAIRYDLFQVLGDWAYATWMNHARLEPVEGMPDGDRRRPIKFVARDDRRPLRNLFDGERRSQIAAVLRRHGFTDAW